MTIESSRFQNLSQTESAIIQAEIPKKITTGVWVNGETLVPWTFIATQERPPIHAVTAAFCLPITSTGEVCLIQHRNRGYEFTGGHCEPNETPEETAAREAREEAGIVLQNLQYFGYKEVVVPQATPHRNPQPGKLVYPNPSYVLYFGAEIAEQFPNWEPIDDMIIATKTIPFNEAFKLLASDQNHHLILHHYLENISLHKKT